MIKTMSWGVLWRTLRYPFFMLTLLVVPRLMGAETYGRFAVFLAICVLCENVADLGSMQTFGRFLPEIRMAGEAATRHFFHLMLFWGMVCATGIAGAVTGVFLWCYGDVLPVRWLGILVLVMLLSKLQGTLYAFMYGMNEIGRFSSRALIRSACRFFLVVLFYWWGGLEATLWAFVCNELILLGVACCWTYSYVLARWHIPAFSEFFTYLKFGLSFYIPFFLLTLLQRSGNVIIRTWGRGDADSLYRAIAQFDLANQFLLLTVSFFAIFLLTLVPSLTELTLKKDQARLENWLRLIIAYCGVVAVLAVTALNFFGPAILKVLGPGFEGTYTLALLISPAVWPLILIHLGFNMALVDKNSRLNCAAAGIGLCCMLLLFRLLIPHSASIGAVAATVLGYHVYAGVFLIHYRHLFIRILKPFALTWAVGLVSLGICMLLPVRSMVWSCAGFTLMALLQVLLFCKSGVIKMQHAADMRAVFRPASGAQ